MISHLSPESNLFFRPFCNYFFGQFYELFSCNYFLAQKKNLNILRKKHTNYSSHSAIGGWGVFNIFHLNFGWPRQNDPQSKQKSFVWENLWTQTSRQSKNLLSFRMGRNNSAIFCLSKASLPKSESPKIFALSLIYVHTWAAFHLGNILCYSGKITFFLCCFL